MSGPLIRWRINWNDTLVSKEFTHETEHRLYFIERGQKCWEPKVSRHSRWYESEEAARAAMDEAAAVKAAYAAQRRVKEAAPELLAALVALLAERSGAAQLSNASLDARAAIAKATGEGA